MTRISWWPAALMLALALGPAFTFERAYASGFGVLVVMVGFAVGIALAWASTRWRWDVLTTVVVTAAVYLFVGGPIVASDTIIAGVIPSLDTVQVMALGVVHSWRDLLTAHLPASGIVGAAVLPWLTSIPAGLLSSLLTIRFRRPILGAIPLLALAFVAVAWGPSGHQPRAWLWALWIVLLLGWLAWITHRQRVGEGRDVVLGSVARRSNAPQTVLDPVGVSTVRAAHAGRRVLFGLLSLLLAGVAATSVAMWVPTNRVVLRDLVEPPLELHAYASPLSSFRHYTTNLADVPVVTLSQLPQGERVRIGVMDSWDGITFTASDPAVSGNGRYVATSGAIGTVGPESVRIDITTSDVIGPWMPSVGTPARVEFSPDDKQLADGLHMNPWADALLTTAAPRTWSGSYTVFTTIIPTRADGQLADVQTLPLKDAQGAQIPDQIREMGLRLTGSELTPLGKARAIERYLSREGFYSSQDTGQSRPGHRADRLTRMVTLEQLVGDDEQYAALMALMLQSQGIPARVVMGAYPEDAAATGEVVLRGRDIHAWVEVPFEDLGWAVFDPSPPRDQVPQTDNPKPRSVPRPQVLQPPDPPEPPVELPPNVTERNVENGPDPGEPLPWALIVGIGGGLVLLFGPIVFVLVLKALRTRRRKAATGVDGMRGAWEETLDLAADAGAKVPPQFTRMEAARTLHATFHPGLPLTYSRWAEGGASVSPVVDLARRVDTAQFSGRETSKADLLSAWVGVETLRSSLSHGASWWRRARRRLSLRSLRRGRRAS